ncbi:hypothetical protein ACKI1I_37485 [Streptomyces turgidiscabies]|uniref:Uncharacterized protein n=1 Tax=Streptomyces turgidiscabies (strain Car8) TaxID=698760 RepID=L7FAX5_STRT8|nr:MULTISPECIES: hypothetical protein [Streptomyces]ELP68412.1 hypothetical protein STRTUCAR8_09789 [Streptomyces turgidiscabies Car8]MDX3499517.1 hypothetical protein [Streptomyces turgidiscabies]GAQ76535.1 hypothetical protein T45_08330 [Streptomyces turgidiscabies]
MPIQHSDAPSPSDDTPTPDALLHTGAEHGGSAEDLVLATGRDLTPRNLAWAERKLAAEGRAALDKLLP